MICPLNKETKIELTYIDSNTELIDFLWELKSFMMICLLYSQTITRLKIAISILLHNGFTQSHLNEQDIVLDHL